MNIKFNIEKSRRKALAQKIGELTGSEVKYLGVPSCGYQIGAYTLDKEAVLHGGALPERRKMRKFDQKGGDSNCSRTTPISSPLCRKAPHSSGLRISPSRCTSSPCP